MFCRNALLKLNNVLLRENKIVKIIPFYQYALYSDTEQPIPTDSVKAARKIKIYTKTGDKGKTSLYTGERRFKNDITFDALGNGDELNSSIGLAREFCCDNKSQEFRDLECKLIKIQSILLVTGSHIATPLNSANQKQLERLTSFDTNLIKELENWIDKYDEELPVLKNFILPSGGKCASTLHICRSVCRRLERSLQPILQSNNIDPNVCVYINRLSDFFFMAARYVSMKEKKEEIIFKMP